jgi:hypothetical protein
MSTIGDKNFPAKPEIPNQTQAHKENSSSQKIAEKILNADAPTVTPIKTHVQKLDQAFIPSLSLYKTFYPHIHALASSGDAFNVGLFLTGLKSEPNTSLFVDAVTELKALAQIVRKTEDIDITLAYKKLIGMIDKYDEKATGTYKSRDIDPKSTFYIRSALLAAAQEDSASIDSWMVYTKKGKPSSSNELWGFLDEWKNWVPEAQGKIAKYIETAVSKIRVLSREYADNDIVLMKGGYGAGKTRMTQALFAQQNEAVVGPDKAKHSVRRSMPALTHAKAHIEGSQVAFQLFDACIRDINGTVAYDSSLSDPADIKNYIQKIKESKRYNKALSPLANEQPVLKIYDLARKDEARFLAVLRREVQGEEPLIPPELIKRGAIKDKMNRLDCMKAVMNETGLNVEYNFISGDTAGWNTDFVAKIQSCSRPIELKKENISRLALEGFVPESFASGSLASVLTKEKVEANFDQIFQQPVYKIMQGLSLQENRENDYIFSNRILIDSIEQPIKSVRELYALLHPKVKVAIPKEAFEKAFEGINEANFLKDINEAKRLTYLELPFVTAAAIHCQLNSDPFS